uniref:Peptidase M12B propeptide domain-containing protein n=1 Tax=Clastoptera arizonana TaxID=38151 RepID=A0A1B6CSJ8_9HEMI
MAYVGGQVLLCACFLIISSINIECSKSDRTGWKNPASDFSQHSVFKPRIYHGLKKREVHSTKEHKNSLIHLHHITIEVKLNKMKYVLDLRLNKDLIPKNYFEKHQFNGSYVVNKKGVNDTELCHYHGTVRGYENSWAAISTCRGLRGVFYDGKILHYLDNANDTDEDSLSFKSDHYHYSHDDLISNATCGKLCMLRLQILNL